MHSAVTVGRRDRQLLRVATARRLDGRTRPERVAASGRPPRPKKRKTPAPERRLARASLSTSSLVTQVVVVVSILVILALFVVFQGGVLTQIQLERHEVLPARIPHS